MSPVLSWVVILGTAIGSAAMALVLSKAATRQPDRMSQRWVQRRWLEEQRRGGV